METLPYDRKSGGAVRTAVEKVVELYAGGARWERDSALPATYVLSDELMTSWNVLSK